MMNETRSMCFSNEESDEIFTNQAELPKLSVAFLHAVRYCLLASFRLIKTSRICRRDDFDSLFGTFISTFKERSWSWRMNVHGAHQARESNGNPECQFSV
jgi:hypothetical protein